MEVSRIIAEIDSQISKLQQARALLSETSAPSVEPPVKRAGRGRPKGSKNSVKKAVAVAKTASPAVAAVKGKAKRKLSPEGRKRIADAMKKRWAERRKTAAK